MQTAGSSTERDRARHGADATTTDTHLALAFAVLAAALWVLGCAALAAAGYRVLSLLGSFALLAALAGLVVYSTPAGAARRPMLPTDWSRYDRRHIGTARRRVRVLGRAITAVRTLLRRVRRLLHRHGAGTPYPVSMPPGARGAGAPARPALPPGRDAGRREAL